MKRKLVSIGGIVVVLLLVVICAKYFREKSITEQNMGESLPSNVIVDVSAQDGEPDEALADIIKQGTGRDVDPKNIVAVGKAVRDGKYSYQVDSWSVQKEYPGYALPEDRTPLGESPGAELDEAGNITNEFSYVVVEIEVENLRDEKVTEHLWGYIRLGIVGEGAYFGEITYLGEKNPRVAGKSYWIETLGAHEKEKIALIFVVQDEFLEENQLFLKINASGNGMGVVSEAQDDIRRYIVLD